MLKNSFRLMLYFLGFAVLGGIAVFLFFRLVNFDRTIEVPSLIGKSIPDAEGFLKDKGFSLKIEGEGYDLEIPRDYIIRQDIKQGEKVESGTVIKVFVSKGKAMFTIPYFEGMDINDVELTVKRSGIEIGKITMVRSDTVEKDRVITQRPLPGYFSDNKVNLVVSLGLYDVSYRCPLFVDMTIIEARKTAKALGLKLVEQKRGRVVVLQKPEAGTIVKKGDSIEITLGRSWGLWF
ncbi:MAG: PASTA domain-containing protein [Thermodesulfovibrionia bacterium]